MAESKEYWAGFRAGRARQTSDEGPLGSHPDYRRGFLEGDSAADEAENGFDPRFDGN